MHHKQKNQIQLFKQYYVIKILAVLVVLHICIMYEKHAVSMRTDYISALNYLLLTSKTLFYNN